MGKTYIDFVCDMIHGKAVGEPIYTSYIAEGLASAYDLELKESAAAAAVALKRIMDGKMIPQLRRYQKGIYYITADTPFGEIGIDKERLIADKYILPDKGYETGPAVLHQMGLTTQMPKERIIATNIAKECARTDKKLGVTIRPPKTKVTAYNKKYLQTLDALELISKAPVDAERPYITVADHIRKHGLKYDNLLALADRYYTKNTILQLAHAANAGGIKI